MTAPISPSVSFFAIFFGGTEKNAGSDTNCWISIHAPPFVAPSTSPYALRISLPPLAEIHPPPADSLPSSCISPSHIFPLPPSLNSVISLPVSLPRRRPRQLSVRPSPRSPLSEIIPSLPRSSTSPPSTDSLNFLSTHDNRSSLSLAADSLPLTRISARPRQAAPSQLALTLAMPCARND